MSAQDANALLAEAADLYVGDDASSLINMGSLRNVVFTGEIIQIKIDSDNNGTILNKARINGAISAEWLEAGDMDNVAEVFKGLVTAASVAGTPVAGASQVVASGSWNYNVMIIIANQNGDQTQPTINSVTLGTDGAIVLNTDYMVVKDAGTNEWGIIIIDSATVTTESQTVTINYDYTPAASKTLTGGASMQTATDRYVRLIAESEDSASITRQIDLAAAVATSPILMQFLDTETSQDVGVMPVTFTNNKGAAWTITDEINAS